MNRKLIILAPLTAALVIAAAPAAQNTTRQATVAVRCNGAPVMKGPLEFSCSVPTRVPPGQKTAYQLTLINRTGYGKLAAKTIAWVNVNYSLPGQKVWHVDYPQGPTVRGKKKSAFGRASLRTGTLPGQQSFNFSVYVTMPKTRGRFCNKLQVSYAGGPTFSLVPACVQVVEE